MLNKAKGRSDITLPTPVYTALSEIKMITDNISTEVESSGSGTTVQIPPTSDVNGTANESNEDSKMQLAEEHHVESNDNTSKPPQKKRKR